MLTGDVILTPDSLPSYLPSFGPKQTGFWLLLNQNVGPWLVWLGGLSAGLQTKRSLVRFPVRAHAWVMS